MSSSNAKLNAWVKVIQDLCQPERVQWCNGSEQEYAQLIGLLESTVEKALSQRAEILSQRADQRAEFTALMARTDDGDSDRDEPEIRSRGSSAPPPGVRLDGDREETPSPPPPKATATESSDDEANSPRESFNSAEASLLVQGKLRQNRPYQSLTEEPRFIDDNPHA